MALTILAGIWGREILPEDFSDCCDRTPTSFKVSFDVLGTISDYIAWLTTEITPEYIEIKRNNATC